MARRSRVSLWLAVAALPFASACSIDIPEGVYACATDEQCPPDFVCRTDNLCWLTDDAIDAGGDSGRDAMTNVSEAGTDAGGDAALVDADLPDAITVDAPVTTDDAGPLDAGAMDAGADAGSIDAGLDADTMDAGVDSGVMDAGSDAGPTDASRDARADTGARDTGVDAPFDAGTDSGTDSGVDAGPDASVCGPIDSRTIIYWDMNPTGSAQVLADDATTPGDDRLVRGTSMATEPSDPSTLMDTAFGSVVMRFEPSEGDEASSLMRTFTEFAASDELTVEARFRFAGGALPGKRHFIEIGPNLLRIEVDRPVFSGTPSVFVHVGNGMMYPGMPVTAAADINDGIQHLAVVVQAGTVRIYLNGTFLHMGTAAVTSLSNADRVRLSGPMGSMFMPTSFHGDIDRVRISDVARSEMEIQDSAFGVWSCL